VKKSNSGGGAVTLRWPATASEWNSSPEKKRELQTLSL